MKHTLLLLLLTTTLHATEFFANKQGGGVKVFL